MLHQFGPNVTSGLPYVSAIEESVEWTEKSYRHIDEAAEFGVIRDAQGIRADGSRWRYFGTFMGYAGYYRIQAEHAALFDQLLDSVCIRD